MTHDFKKSRMENIQEAAWSRFILNAKNEEEIEKQTFNAKIS